MDEHERIEYCQPVYYELKEIEITEVLARYAPIEDINETRN